jgi:hypothetical protein
MSSLRRQTHVRVTSAGQRFTRTHRVHNFRWGSYDASGGSVYSSQWRICEYQTVSTLSLHYVLQTSPYLFH